MSQFNDPTLGGGAPPPKKSSAMMWIIILLVVLLGIPLLCCGGCMLLGMWGLNQGSAQIAAELQDAPAVQEHLGDNLKLSMNFTATAQEQQKAGNDKLVAFDATGSKGSGTIIVTTSQAGANTFESAVLRLPDGREFPLQ